MSGPALRVLQDVPLAPRTTLEVGGPARFYTEARDAEEVGAALAWAREHALVVEVLGGGSNVLVADRGLDALVLRVRDERLERRHQDGDCVVDAGAGVRWDELVRSSVERDEAGLECLSGIPGDVGAAPMQNVGAYGQEVSETIERVEAIDRKSSERVTFDPQQCCFGYRDSIFKGAAAGRYVVTSVRFRLRRGGAPTVRYPELDRALGDEARTLAGVRRAVLALRRSKSMVIDPADENRRSAGSFFLNPVVPAELAERVQAIAGKGMPRFAAGAGEVKLSAAWLIERAGMTRGMARGAVGLSTRHCLALVNRGGATAAAIVALAAEIRARVHARFGVVLKPEPRLLGFRAEEIAPLVGELTASA